MEQQIITNKISYVQKMADQFLIRISSTESSIIVSNPTTCSYLFIIISYKTKHLFTILLSLVAVHTHVAVYHLSCHVVYNIPIYAVDSGTL